MQPPKAVQRLCERYSATSAITRAWFGLSPRELLMQEAMDFVCLNGVEGDYLEFGTYRGNSLIHAYYAREAFIHLNKPTRVVARVAGSMDGRAQYTRIRHAIGNIRFIGFDSFQGLPAPTEPEEALFGAGDYACSRDELEENLRENQVDRSRVEIVEGFFKDTLTEETRVQHALKEAALIHIDCDLYEPALQALEFVRGLIGDGTVIIFDDWDLYKGHPDKGEQRAFKEFRQRHPGLRVSPFKSNNSFMFHL